MTVSELNSSSFSLSQIKVISFDLDDTLWNGTQVLIKAEQAVQQWMATHAKEISAGISSKEMRDRKINFIKNNPHLINQISQARQLFLANLFSEFNYANPDEMAKECFEQFYQARQQVQLFEGVIDSLVKLKNHVRLIAITNGNANIELVGLRDYFEFCLNAEDFIKPKPHGDIFMSALEKADIQAHECLHVGDHPVHDMLGAFDVGMATCWLEDGSRDWQQDFSPNLTIKNVKELAQLF